MLDEKLKVADDRKIVQTLLIAAELDCPGLQTG